MKKIISMIALEMLLMLSFTIKAQEVAITMDNPNTDTKPLFSAQERDERILATLKKHHIKAALFVQGSQVDSAEGAALLNRWNEAGHLLGNHTYSHQSLADVTEADDEQDTLHNEKLLSPYSQFKKIFRFPFLKEGDTAEKRDAFRAFLKVHDYQYGSVTIDATDWYISDRLEKRLSENPRADISGFKKYYLDHMWSRAQYYDGLAKEVLGRSPKHTLLMHHNLLNALFLDDLISMFESKGWKVIDAASAFKDPVFKHTPDIVPAGESLIWGLAKETGRYDDKLRYPGEDETYEKDAMDRLGL